MFLCFLLYSSMRFLKKLVCCNCQNFIKPDNLLTGGAATEDGRRTESGKGRRKRRREEGRANAMAVAMVMGTAVAAAIAMA